MRLIIHNNKKDAKNTTNNTTNETNHAKNNKTKANNTKMKNSLPYLMIQKRFHQLALYY